MDPLTRPATGSTLTRPRNVILAGAAGVILLAGVLWSGLSGVGGPAGPVTATGAVDLAGWKLTTPAQSEDGHAASINPATSAEPWLVRNDDGSLTFWAPVVGATTRNSDHPRTELVSLNEFQAGSDARTLRASVAVTQAPTGSENIILGQIHGAGPINSVPFVMLHYKAGVLEVVVKKKRGGSTAARHQLLSDVELGEMFDFTISDADNGDLVFTATAGSDTRRVTAPIPDAFRNATVRFQAGAYQLGDAGLDAADGARVTFYRLREEPAAR